MKTSCPTCGGEYEQGRECPICAKMDEIKMKAIESGLLREHRRQRPKKTESEPVEGQWWQA